MNVASLELCKELYEVSGWQTENNYHDNLGTPVVLSASVNQDGTFYKAGVCPAYDLGYLLRKLPGRDGEDVFSGVALLSQNSDKWGCRYKKSTDKEYAWGVADNPEDATTKLAIELFKQGVLRKEQTDV